LRYGKKRCDISVLGVFAYYRMVTTDYKNQWFPYICTYSPNMYGYFVSYRGAALKKIAAQPDLRGLTSRKAKAHCFFDDADNWLDR
jgi:hypothetical protein